MDKDQTSVPFIVHESIVSRMERTVKRLWILCIIMFVSLIVTNGMWICYENSFEDVVTTQSITQGVDAGDGGNAIINDGVHINGEGEANSKDDH